MAKHQSRFRTAKSIRRPRGKGLNGDVTLIVCEAETEQLYWEEVHKRVRPTGSRVKIAMSNRGPDPGHVLAFALQEHRAEGGYDHIFCIFDHDDRSTADDALEQIGKLASRSRTPLPIKAIMSTPCFEFWVLPHFCRTDAPYSTCGAVEREVRRYLPSYNKADREICKELAKRADVAMENGRWLAQRGLPANSNPSTQSHLVLEHLLARSTRS